MRYSILFFLLFAGLCSGQNPNSYNLQIHQYNYPSNPLPNTCEVYGVSAAVENKSIITYDYRGDRLSLKDLKLRNLSYNPSNSPLIPKLYAFSKYHKSEIPYENGFLLKLDMDDVVLFHEYTGKEGIYNINSEYEIRLSVSHKDKVIVTDTLRFGKTVGSFTSELPAEDVHIIATNKANELASSLTDNIMSSAIGNFHQFSKNLVDLSFTKDFIRFYGISKQKKLITGEETKVVEKRIKKLEQLDKNILKRDAFNNEVKELTAIFMNFKTTEDYKNYEGYRFYVQANLASLYTLGEIFDKVPYHYNLALTHTEKSRFKIWINDELNKTMRRKENKSLLFDGNMKFNDGYSASYLEIYNTRKRVIN